MYEISQEDYHVEVKAFVLSESDKIRQTVYGKMYELVSQHVSEPDNHESFIIELTDEAINLIKEQL